MKSRLPSRVSRAFTLLELMLAIAIFSLLMVIVFSIINGTGTIWKSTTSKIESFQSARAAFDSMTRKIGQATLNMHYDYFDSAGKAPSDPTYNNTPKSYGVQSELHFIIGKQLLSGQVTHAIFFQAPLGQTGSSSFSPLTSLLNGCGYYVRFGDDSSSSSLSARPSFITDAISPSRYRYQLMEFSQPSEELKVYNTTNNSWFTSPLSASPPAARVLAENVVALVLLPKVPSWQVPAGQDAKTYLSDNYEYDSRLPWKGAGGQPAVNQLCPLLEIIMVVIDSTTAQRLHGTSSTPPDLGFNPAGLFLQVSQLEDDLASVRNGLTDKKINYHIFRTELSLSNNTWTPNRIN